MSFDEGGFGCRSRLCPLRVYNQSKSDKFCVELFALTNASMNEHTNQLTYNNFMCHLDVYQGKNAAEIGVLEEAKGLPTTQKL